MRRGCLRWVREKDGQTLIMFTLFLVVIVLFVGLGIDVGFAYVTKASLSKAVDAAALAGTRNLSLGQQQATAIAQSTFTINYGHPGRDVGSPVVNLLFTTDSSKNTYLNIDATATINTYFIRILPLWKTLQVRASAQATRSPLIMTLVLDRSGSMNPQTGTTRGGSTLPAAVKSFIQNFDDNNDQVAMASFASTATVDVPMGHPFKANIINAANNLIYVGGTFSPGGLTNAVVQENSVSVAAGQNVVRVVVFFTDGLANMIQQTLQCPPATLWNFGGYDQAGSGAAFFSPTAPVTQSGQNNASCTVPDNGTPSCCHNTSRFMAYQYGTLERFTTANITAESKYECIQIANVLRANNVTVYCIGLGGSSVDMSFLAQVANAPNSITFNSAQPVGDALYAPTPAQLNTLFQQIASEILLRLTQ